MCHTLNAMKIYVSEQNAMLKGFQYALVQFSFKNIMMIVSYDIVNPNYVGQTHHDMIFPSA